MAEPDIAKLRKNLTTWVETVVTAAEQGHEIELSRDQQNPRDGLVYPNIIGQEAEAEETFTLKITRRYRVSKDNEMEEITGEVT